ncbi:MAG TPA: transposase [Planctomycetes bacterium]|nr:transposase [Fuerstiella sp.]HIK95154.1 transposase [Planctomycetota bacterium]
MSDYRRWFVAGATYFFTLVTYRRRPLFAEPHACQILGTCMRHVCDEMPFTVTAIVLLPDHLHAVMNLPSGDNDYATRWKRIKRNFTVQWLDSGGKDLPVTTSEKRRGQRGIWQSRFWEHVIRDEGDLENHVDYIHFNPVKHKYVAASVEWPHSSFHRFVRLGHYPADWGRSEPRSIQSMDLE